MLRSDPTSAIRCWMENVRNCASFSAAVLKVKISSLHKSGYLWKRKALYSYSAPSLETNRTRCKLSNLSPESLIISFTDIWSFFSPTTITDMSSTWLKTTLNLWHDYWSIAEPSAWSRAMRNRCPTKYWVPWKPPWWRRETWTTTKLTT